jgi:hypothetical protein
MARLSLFPALAASAIGATWSLGCYVPSYTAAGDGCLGRR